MRKSKILITLISLMLLLSIETSVIALASSGIVNVETLRVREKPTTESKIVELVSIGDEIKITGESGNWYQVKVGKITGYVRKDLLTVEDSENESNNENNNTSTTVNSNPNENLNGSQSGGENAGANENPTTPQQNINITTVNKFDITINTINFGAEGVSVGAKKQIQTGIKIKLLPSANSRNIVELPANTEITVLEVMNNWCRIEAGENVGWVRIGQ